ncbi:hypothetical protein F1D05_16250 [Kribbella qitaiheensis]|uniref:Uncharacterized protein n=1 Tax=Kribbella qitaiheensis TaxID=1544730 RepID=A0A7G6WWL5_9ACTN|nr:hypothetical protein [Kribbella qitaiheensis]QNE18380.1 hypothetical protein F1D05_11340 [Kribbella qitaiheensis]QNE19182.1 hypothetical protein F1D05_16250 [Kribbella qitaiheensis]
MTALQQGWIFCADGFGWLQRLTPEGLLSPDSMRVDISSITSPADLPDTWSEFLSGDGWYIGVPVRMVNELAANHGDVIDVQSSYIDWQTPSADSDNPR